MRAAVTDSRPVPPGFNLMPVLSTWSLSGGATYDPVTQTLALPVVSASATAPLVRVDEADAFTWTADIAADPDAERTWIASTVYLGADGVTRVESTGGWSRNGRNGKLFTPDWSIVLGPGIVYMQLGVGVYGTPGTVFRRGSLTLSRSR